MAFPLGRPFARLYVENAIFTCLARGVERIAVSRALQALNMGLGACLSGLESLQVHSLPLRGFHQSRRPLVSQSGLTEESDHQESDRKDKDVRHESDSYLLGAQSEGADLEGGRLRLRRSSLIPHRVDQHREVQHRHAARDALDAREARTCRAKKYREPEMTVLQGLGPVLVE